MISFKLKLLIILAFLTINQILLKQFFDDYIVLQLIYSLHRNIKLFHQDSYYLNYF